MPLVANLSGSFSKDGFSFTASASAIGGPMAGFRPAAPSIDTSGFGGITGRLGNVDLGGISQAAGRISAQGRLDLGRIASPAGLIAPLVGLVENAERFTSSDMGGLLDRLRQAGEGQGGLGLGPMMASSSAILGLRSDSAVGSALQLVGTVAPGGINLDGTLGQVSQHGTAIATLLRLLGALMAEHSQAERIGEVSMALAGLMPREGIENARDRLLAWSGNRDLAGRIAAADPADPAAVEDLAKAVGDYMGDLGGFARLLERGLGFGEAALVQADLPARAVAMDAAGVVLAQTPADPIRASAEQLAAWFDGIFPRDFGANLPSFADAVAAGNALMADAAAAINGIDASRVTAPITGAINSAVGVVHEINRVLDTIVGGIRSVFETVRQVVSALDLRPVADAIKTALKPVVEAIQALDDLLSTALAGIQTAMTAITNAISGLKTAILAGATAIHDTFARVAEELKKIPLDSVVGALRQGVREIADSLGQIRLEPYFQASVDVTNTAADIIANVPLGILPDDAKKKVDEAVAEIQAIDFDAQVRQVLSQAMDKILKDLDDEVLKDIQDLYQQLLDFLATIDPRSHIADWERLYFQPLIDHLLAIDPDTILKPVADAIASVKDRIRDLDIREQVLGEVNRVFADILARFDEFNPATLIQPLVARVQTVRQAILDRSDLSHWAETVDDLAGRLNAALAVLDPALLLPRLQGAYDAFVGSLGGGRQGSLVGGIIAALLQDSMEIRPASWQAVTSWIGGGDGPADLHALIDPAASRLQGTLDTVRAIDPAAVAGAMMEFHRGLAAAVAALPAGSALRLRLEPALARSPMDILATAIANRPDYDAALVAALAAVGRKQGSDFSEVVTASQGLRAALRPLSLIVDRLVGLAKRFGVDPLGKDAAAIFADILAALSPANLVAMVAPVVTALKAKITSIVQDALVTPIKAGIAELVALIAHIDLGVLRDELAALHAQIRAQIEAFSPGAILGDVLDAFDTVRHHLLDYDPLQPVRTVINTFKQAVADLAAPDSPVRPTKMLEGVVEAYEEILAIAGALNVRELVGPILDRLHDLAGQLDQGLGEAEGAFVHLQQALGQATGSSADVSVSVSAGAA